MCMIEHQETRELMMNEDVDDEIAEVVTAAAKGKKLKVRHRFRGNIVSVRATTLELCSLSLLGFVLILDLNIDVKLLGLTNIFLFKTINFLRDDKKKSMSLQIWTPIIFGSGQTFNHTSSAQCVLSLLEVSSCTS